MFELLTNVFFFLLGKVGKLEFESLYWWEWDLNHCAPSPFYSLANFLHFPLTKSNPSPQPKPTL